MPTIQDQEIDSITAWAAEAFLELEAAEASAAGVTVDRYRIAKRIELLFHDADVRRPMLAVLQQYRAGLIDIYQLAEKLGIG